ncbi:FecR domain-containing protein [Niabella pedocola]|uniref:FecR domain-containing protein n=1 Tax=Niabella pedocola TaxID=1752077 RepID=A0ABS8PX05_9BACT|nr:FecR domain-containing protein [Niabella pedocola]MCD2424868.1 FecR domain-containing protein [Niabella pedocola]
MKKADKYRQYVLGDFLCDEYFQDWIHLPDEEKNAFWEQWLQANPGKQQEIGLAREILFNIGFKTSRPDPLNVEASLNRALAAIEECKQRPAGPRGFWVAAKRWKAAAVLIPLLLISSLIFWRLKTPGQYTVNTGYGKISRLVLPDSSVVVLNANSTIKYGKKWDKNAPRELWLNGEAFFDVKHLDNDHNIENYERFIVHTVNTTVEVLGTSFDIRERRGRTEISLQKGAIRVFLSKTGTQPVLMKPGDILLVDSVSVIHRTSNIEHALNASSWKEKKLVLSDPTLSEIFKYLEDTYGKSFILEDPELARKKLNGPILIDSLDDALFVMSTALNISFTNEGDQIRVNFK